MRCGCVESSRDGVKNSTATVRDASWRCRCRCRRNGGALLHGNHAHTKPLWFWITPIFCQCVWDAWNARLRSSNRLLRLRISRQSNRLLRNFHNKIFYANPNFRLLLTLFLAIPGYWNVRKWNCLSGLCRVHLPEIGSFDSWSFFLVFFSIEFWYFSLKTENFKMNDEHEFYRVCRAFWQWKWWKMTNSKR